MQKLKKLIIVCLILLPLGVNAQVADSLSRVVKMEGAVNFRDIGGYKTKDGREVIKNRIYRAADISRLTDRDMEKLAERRIYTVIDFRGKKESAMAPDRLLPGTDYTLCPAGSDNLPSTKDLAEMLKDENFLLSMYGAPSMQHYGSRYKPMFQKLLSLSDSDALMYHCTGGRDRTGMATALILYTLQVPMDIIEADYVASNIYLAPANKNMYKSMIELSGLSEEEITERMKLRPELLQNFFAAIKESYGSVENFMEKELGVGAGERAFLIRKFTK
ncbi:tyrosine-protein phosphatase [Bacteroides sp. 51]|uniref:tyrosine-protein phosphatase n=1 Tax=Bacteroides sp. 51 TaxID=2302938 RepID=UPI0013D8B3D1|nr:tyrosine-protein phosphatase [Bacteroides sp. 51]NDV83791.1 tyrosine-protein phosphatase [Bacteroides sp. 51]